MYKLVIVSKKVNPPEGGRSWMEAQCEFYQDSTLLVKDITLKSPVDCFQATAEEKCEELENIFDTFNGIPNEITIDKAAREQARLELRGRERIEADKFVEKYDESR